MNHIVIVGGGFGGISAARELDRDGRFQVTLISQRHCFEYHAALYRSATGRSKLEVAVPLDDIFDGTDVEVVIDEVVKIDAKKKTLVCASKERYHFDQLIVATGVQTSYFGIKGLDKYSYSLKTVEDALKLKNHLHAELTTGHKPDLNYVVIGGGPSGVELAGELVFYLRQLRQNHGIKKPFHVDLVEAAPRLLPNLPEKFSRQIQKRLESLGVNVYTSTAVKGETSNSLQLPHGSIHTHTVIWTAGVTNSTLCTEAPKTLFKLGKGARVSVDDRLMAHENVWVIGDSAETVRSGWAQTAAYDGKYVARNLIRHLDGLEHLPYQPSEPIGAIPVGPGWCAVNMNGQQFYGYSGWVVRRWADLKLMRSIMPTGLAWKAWLHGRIAEETCPQCRQR